MKKTILITATILGVLQLIYYLGPTGDSEPPRDNQAVYPQNSLPTTTGNLGLPLETKLHLPSELRDYSKFRERMLARGRTEEQISRDYTRAIRKYLRDNPKVTYESLLNSGLDPEYDLNELDSGLDEQVEGY